MSETETSGAKFVRADLHIHSFGPKGSFDVKDQLMTPENIVDTALDKGLKIISITDHNEIGNVEKALEYARGKDICVIPGIEVSTTQGHLLIYFKTFITLNRFFKKLNIADDRESCTQGIVDCLDFAQQFDGIGILAHIELSSGFERTIGKFGPQMQQVLTHPCLLGMEISQKSSVDFYSLRDESEDRKQMLRKRCEALGLPSDYEFPKTMSSDSHTITKLGTNADGENKLTRIKVDEPSFDGFRIALLSAKSRIRIEDCIPESFPRFKKIELEGGLFGKAAINLSSNLTCIIGGRGAGKSTLLEAIRISSGNASSVQAKVVDSEVWPTDITLTYEDEAGQITTFKREIHGEVLNLTNQIDGISKVDIESYGQGYTAETLQHSEKNPQLLLNFLDTFIDLDALKSADEDVRELLRDNQSTSAKLRLEVAAISDTQKAVADLKRKLEHLKEGEAEKLVELQAGILRERDFRKQVVNGLNELIKSFREILSDKSVFENFDLLTSGEIIVGKEEFGNLKKIVLEFSTIVDSKSNELNTELKAKVEELKVQLIAWKKKEADAQEKIDLQKKELERKGIPFDLGKIRQISNDLIYQTKRLQELKTKQKELQRLTKERKTLIQKRKKIKNEIFYKRLNFSKKTNENLKSSVDGFFVSMKFEQGKFSPDFENTLKTFLNWRTTQVQRTSAILNTISPLEFAERIQKKDFQFLKTIKDENGGRIFSDPDIENIQYRLLENRNYEDFESIYYEDKPTITVTKESLDTNGKKKMVSRLMSRLSLGQQQSILLAILIQSDSQKPLIIDQPEDNLDSEFIFKTVVSNLNKIKEQRQVIIVTHNPNIAVLGDAELILPLKSTSTKSHVLNRGSIDRPETRKLCCEILEGGTRAFEKRRKIYGIPKE